MMKIRISTESLAGSNTSMLWSGALYGLKRLQQLGHQVFFIADELSKQQKKLIENEHIKISTSAPDEIDLQIITENGALAAINSDGSEIEKADDWIELSDKICFPTRTASLKRTTAETDIQIDLNIDGTGDAEIQTGLEFFDHMLEQIAKHGLMDLRINCEGDLDVDEHHTIEDVAITLGETMRAALGDKVGIDRYGFTLPMDESRAEIAIDFSGRPYLQFEGSFSREKIGDFPTEMVEHFFYSFAINAQTTLHIKVTGDNDHHKVEACFKGFARCIRAAVSRSERNKNILPSTKDLL